VWRISSFLLVVIATALSGCFAAELAAPHFLESDPVEIVGGYLLATEAGYGYVITMPPRQAKDGSRSYDIVATNVESLGWGDEFILFESRPLSSESFEWHIMNTSTHQHYSCSIDRLPVREDMESKGIDASNICTTYDEYLELRKSLGVPDAIEMQEPGQAYAVLEE
jgi:hypothetical protein